MTLQAIDLFSNIEKIPMILKEDGCCKVKIAVLNKDKKKLEDWLNHNKPCWLSFEILGVSNQKLLEGVISGK